MGRRRLLLCCTSHFWVDLACAALLLGRCVTTANPAMTLLLYNGFAFAVQMPVGLLADRLNRSQLVAATGCLLVLLAWLLPSGIAAAVVAGLGNAAFHVGGGLDTMNHSGGRISPLGLFVSPGAVGLWLGGVWALRLDYWTTPICIGLALLAVLLALQGRGLDNAPAQMRRKRGDVPVLACLLAVVILRSWLGMSGSLPWKAELGVWAVIAVAAGKAAGGLLADRLGPKPVAAASLVLSAVCFGLGGTVIGFAALFLFQMTMPLTLWAAARQLPGAKGFAFGLLTFGLFLGYLPEALGAAVLTPIMVAFGALVGLPPLLLSLRERKEKMP